MASLRRLDRPDRRIPTADGLDAITRAAAAGTQVNLDPRAMSVDAPQIDVRGFLDEARGAAAIGRGIETVGSATMKLAEEQGRAVALNQKYEAENQLGMIETDLGTAIAAEPDELKHGEILNAHLERAQRDVLSKPRLGIAQQEVVAAHSRWATQQRHNVMIAQARRSFDKAKENIAGRYTRLIGTGRFAEAQDLAKDPEVVKIMGDDWAARAEVQAQKEQEADAEKTKMESHFGALQKNPSRWLEENQEVWEDDPVMWSRLKNAAEARKGEITSESVDTVVQEIASGMITVPAEVEVRAQELPGLTPSLVEKLKADVLEFDKLASDQEKAANGDKNWLKMWKAAREWKGGTSDQAAEQYREMTKQIRYGVPDDQQGKIMEILYRKMGSKQEFEIPNETEGAMRKIITDMYNRGIFNNGQPMQIPQVDPLDPKGKRTVMVDAPGAIERSAGVEGQLYLDVRAHLQAHPELSNPIDLPNVIRARLPEVIRKNLGNQLDNAYFPKKPVSANTPPFGLNGEQYDPEDITLPGGSNAEQYSKMVGDVTGRQDLTNQLFPVPKTDINFGGVKVPSTGVIENPKITVFGGSSDPDDNGLSAFGGTTGEGGREGVAVPEKLLRHFYGGDKSMWEDAQVEATLPDGTTKILPVADLGTAEWVWKRSGKPVMDLTPGAVEALGGDVIYGRNGTLKGVSGISGVTFRLLPLNK